MNSFLQGVKPVSLGKVSDPQVKQFIEKCLGPASTRLPAMELLKEPFLATENLKDLSSDSRKLTDIVPTTVNLPQHESISMDIDPNCKKFSDESYAKSMSQTPYSSTAEFLRCTEGNKFKLVGEQTDENTISLALRMTDLRGNYSCYIDVYFSSVNM